MTYLGGRRKNAWPEPPLKIPNEEDIFRAVTSNLAKALEKGDEWGYRCVLTVSDGQVVYRNK